MTASQVLLYIIPFAIKKLLLIFGTSGSAVILKTFLVNRFNCIYARATLRRVGIIRAAFFLMDSLNELFWCTCTKVMSQLHQKTIRIKMFILEIINFRRLFFSSTIELSPIAWLTHRVIVVLILVSCTYLPAPSKKVCQFGLYLVFFYLCISVYFYFYYLTLNSS